jgi:hypothetical protein
MRGSFWTRPDFLWSTFLLVGLLIVGAIALALVKRWHRRQSQRIELPEQHLTTYHALVTQGDLTTEELHRITQILAQQKEMPTSSPPARVQDGGDVGPKESSPG